jgi:hypothetical protein
MKTSSKMVFLATTALTGALVAGSSLQGCRSSDTGPSGTGAGAGTTTTTASTGGMGTGGNVVAATVVTIQQIVDPTAPGHVGSAVPVQIQGAVVMSPKFLVSKSSSGNCLWGVFLSAPGITQAAPNTGILALSYGTPASVSDGGTKAYCPVIQPGPFYAPAGDSFADDIAPGDVVDVVGVTDSYVPAECAAADASAGSSQVPSYQLNKVTSVTPHATKAPVPTPYVLTSADIASLAGGSDTTWLDKFGGVRVQIQNVVAESQLGQLTDSYGHMLLQEGTNGIQVGDKIFYQGEEKSVDACYAGEAYAINPPITFTSITGFVYLDYCNWGIEPNDKCFDLNPASVDCLSVVEAAAAADGGADASANAGDAGDGGDAGYDPAQVCLH